MLTSDRHRRILELLEQGGSVTLPALRAVLPVTGMTLWRDLAALEAQGRLRRVRGGAVRTDRAVEPAFGQKARRALEHKRGIAAKAAALFAGDGDVLILEGGTTVAELLPCLKAARLTVLTNSLPILARANAGHRHLALHASGGMLSPVSGNFVGPEAVAFFKRRRARTFFMSATGLDPATGRLTDPNPVEIEVKRAMAAAAARVVLLLDAGKLGVVSAEEVLPLRSVDVIITDRRITPAQRRQLGMLGPKILVA